MVSSIPHPLRVPVTMAFWPRVPSPSRRGRGFISAQFSSTISTKHAVDGAFVYFHPELYPRAASARPKPSTDAFQRRSPFPPDCDPLSAAHLCKCLFTRRCDHRSRPSVPLVASPRAGWG